ncbi:MAG: hypothetical protein MUE98_07190 [Rhodobacteraceae bacterium]|jgi:hypothetical protein|nr:hypothetical protein [Paracoccaceae bacterium]
MAAARLEKLGYRAGVWEGRLSGVSGTDAPRLEVTAGGASVADVQIRGDGAGAWIVSIPIPAAVLGDGIAVFAVTEAGSSGLPLAQFALAVGEPADDDMRAELGLLRAELDLLKRALRRLADKA